MIFIIMGVSGSGKTTVGKLLAQELNLPFYDADDFHPKENIEKMSNGIPLNDEDRIGWLESIAENLREWEKTGGAVLACPSHKESYRKILQSGVRSEITWVYLEGSRSLILERIEARKGHFMSSALLDSQFAALEEPTYGLRLNISSSPKVLVQQILKEIESMDTLSEFGLIGMGVMGKSLALNMAGKEVNISIYNRHVPGKEEGIAENIVLENPTLPIQGFDNLKAFVASLKRPRKILLMIVAGPVVDYQIEELLPHLEEGDVLIDGGNSFYKDTGRRTKALEEKKIHFVGTGISGGEEGALKGPSMMPGGSKEGFAQVKSYLEKIAARDKNGLPCTTYVGPEGAGHFVKMVHNSIEYAEMQVLAEAYYLLRYFLDYSPEEIVEILSEWQTGGLGSYLLEITIDILRKREGNELLLDKILDQAEQKGTGGWSVGAALEYGVPYSSLTEAVVARQISAFKKQRVEASGLYQFNPAKFEGKKEAFASSLRAAYQATRIVNHDIGFRLMQEVSDKNEWALNFSEIARIWTNGCIIRSELMEELSELFKTEKNLLLAPAIVSRMRNYQQDFAYTVAAGLQGGYAMPVLSASLNYFIGFITADSPANLIQAQRDYFGAHTYRRKDKPADQYFHTIWKAL